MRGALPQKQKRPDFAFADATLHAAENAAVFSGYDGILGSRAPCGHLAVRRVWLLRYQTKHVTSKASQLPSAPCSEQVIPLRAPCGAGGLHRGELGYYYTEPNMSHRQPVSCRSRLSGTLRFGQFAPRQVRLLTTIRNNAVIFLFIRFSSFMIFCRSALADIRDFSAAA